MTAESSLRKPELLGGFSLLEVIVALLLIQVVIFGAIGMMYVGARSASRGVLIERAVWSAGALRDSIESGVAAPAGTRLRAWGTLVIVAGGVEARDAMERVLVRLELTQ